MPAPLSAKFTLNDLRGARAAGNKVAMLTCYDYSTARLMHDAGVPALLVGDSAASVILGHDTTLPVPLDFLIQLTAAVRRGAPLAFLVGDMPFGSYHGGLGKAVENVCRMVQLSNCDCIKLETAAGHARLVERLADAGVAVMAHIGLRPQAVGLLGGYKFQGRTAVEAERIVTLARTMESAGAASVLLEAVPPEVAKAVVDGTELPVVGCGAGPWCHGHVFVTHDALGLTPRRPRFVPDLGDVSGALRERFAGYVRLVESGQYPAAQHNYAMPPDELARFRRRNESDEGPAGGVEDDGNNLQRRTTTGM